MFNRTNCDRKSQLSGILTKPFNPREWPRNLKQYFMQRGKCPIYNGILKNVVRSSIANIRVVKLIENLFYPAANASRFF